MSETRTPKQIAADKVAELIEKLEKAEGPDRELDAQIHFRDRVTSIEKIAASKSGHINIQGTNLAGENCLYGDHVPSYTASLDAAVALAERVLKVYRLEIFMDPSGVSAKVTWWPCGLHETDTIIKSEGMGWTPAVSICLATLKAGRAHMHPRDREEN